MMWKAIAAGWPFRLHEMLTWAGLMSSMAIVIYFKGLNGI